MPTYSKINSKLIQVNIANEEILARRGAMIAYTGRVNFAKSFLGAGGLMQGVARQVTGEGMPLMSATGSGEVLFGHMGQHVMIIPVRGETLYIESESVLCFDKRLRAGTSFLGSQGVQGLIRGAATGSGLFTTTFDGTGDVGIISHGNAIALEVTQAKPIFVDPQAYIGHRGQVQSQMVTDMNWKTFLGQGSGESFQLKFTGQGTVFIQASEQ